MGDVSVIAVSLPKLPFATRLEIQLLSLCSGSLSPGRMLFRDPPIVSTKSGKGNGFTLSGTSVSVSALTTRETSALFLKWSSAV